MHITLSLTAQGKPLGSGRFSTQRRCYHRGKSDANFLSGTPENQNRSWEIRVQQGLAPSAVPYGKNPAEFSELFVHLCCKKLVLIWGQGAPGSDTGREKDSALSLEEHRRRSRGHCKIDPCTYQSWSKDWLWKAELITQTKHSDPAEHPRAASGTGAVSQAMDTCFITLSISCETNFFFCPPRNKRSMFLCSISSHAKICICPVILPEA